MIRSLKPKPKTFVSGLASCAAAAAAAATAAGAAWLLGCGLRRRGRCFSLARRRHRSPFSCPFSENVTVVFYFLRVGYKVVCYRYDTTFDYFRLRFDYPREVHTGKSSTLRPDRDPFPFGDFAPFAKNEGKTRGRHKLPHYSTPHSLQNKVKTKQPQHSSLVR